MDPRRGRYRIERDLGAGGMATVYLAHDLEHDREPQLKFYRGNFRSYLRKNEATLHSLLVELAPGPGRPGLMP